MNVILQSRDRAACSDKTLYISDLDGTLLRLDETVSAFTAETVNRLEAEGILFSYATARSYLTASKVTAGITARLPVIVYNGAFIIDSGTRAILSSTYFTEAEAEEIEGILLRSQIFPLRTALLPVCVSSWTGGKPIPGAGRFLARNRFVWDAFFIFPVSTAKRSCGPFTAC